MNTLSIGDLAQSFQMRRQNIELKARLTTLAEELTTGKSADVGRRVSGDFVPLAAIEHSLQSLATYRTATAEAATLSGAVQTSLSAFGDAATSIAPGLLLAGGSQSQPLLDSTGADARAKFSQAFAALGTQVAGRTLFAGAATNGQALASADDVLDALGTAASGATTATEVMDAIAVWFDTPGGGFETFGYLGDTAPAGPMRLANGQSLTLDVTAADPALRETLKGLAAGALLGDASILAGDVAARTELSQRAGAQLVSAEAPLSALRARVGTAQNRIDSIQTENVAQTAMLELARADLVGVDPYDTATELEAVQDQIETLYTLTARLSRLSLADYLR